MQFHIFPRLCTAGCFFLLFTASGFVRADILSPSARANVETVRKMLDQPDDQIDLTQAKLTFDSMV